MQETSLDPLIESSLENEDQVFSEWKILLISPWAVRSRVSLNVGYQNSDFRDRDQESVVDPETYRKLFQEIVAVETPLSLKRSLLMIPLYFGVVFLVAAMQTFVPELNKWVTLGGLLGYLFLAAVTYQFVCGYLFKVADTQLIALVDSYKVHFLEEYGVELGHSKSTNQRIRWWNDDSCIYLRRPRRSLEEGGPLAVLHGSEQEGHFPPIFLLLTVPGDNVMDEVSLDPTMNKARTLLKSTYKEATKTPVLYRAVLQYYGSVLFVIVIAFFFWLVNQQYDYLVTMLVFLIGYTVLVCIGGALVYAASRRRLASYKEVAQRVNEALEKDEQLAHLAVEFHDSELPGYVHLTSPRFQFVRRVDTALSGMLVVMV